MNLYKLEYKYFDDDGIHTAPKNRGAIDVRKYELSESDKANVTNILKYGFCCKDKVGESVTYIVDIDYINVKSYTYWNINFSEIVKLIRQYDRDKKIEGVLECITL
jgi:hypothetical protein